MRRAPILLAAAVLAALSGCTGGSRTSPDRPGIFILGIDGMDPVILQRLNDEAVLLNMSNQQYYGLNDTGTRMWELLMELGEPSKVVTQLQEEYSVPSATLQADLETLVGELLQAGLLRATSPTV